MAQDSSDGTATQPSTGRRLWLAVREVVLIILITILASFLVKTFLFRAYYIPSGSMEQTLQVNDRIFRIAGVNTTAKTFELEGEDTTLYDTFISGSYQIITFGASFQTVQTVSPSGGDYEKALEGLIESARMQPPSKAVAQAKAAG